MLVLAGVVHDLIDLGGSNIARENPAYSAPLGVHFEHDLRRSLAIEAEKFLQHLNDELHGREIVVMHHHLEHGWWFGLGCFSLSAGTTLNTGCHEKCGGNDRCG
jgi:hypothetical protein